MRALEVLREEGQIAGRKPLINILVTMQTPCLIVPWVLDKLKPRNPHLIERFVVSRPAIAHADRRHAQILQGCNPLMEDRNNRSVVLGINPQ